MKIAFVLDDSLDKADGVQQYVLTLGHWYTQQGHEVHYLVGETKRRDVRHVRSLSKNLRVQFNQNRMSTPLPAKRSEIRKLLNQEQFDVLHVQMPFSPFLAARVVRMASPNTVVIGTFHIVPFSWQEKVATRLLRMLVWRALRRFDMTISVSEPARRFAKRSFGVKSVVIPNVVNVAAFHNGKKMRKYTDGKTTIVFLGRLVARKGCMQLLQALQIMHEERLLDGVRVVICGKGPDEARLHEYARQHRLTKCVQFVGFISEIEKANYLASADIAVFPSTGGESFGIVLIEAMAAKAGVVLGGNNIGYKSVLRERPAQLIEPNNAKKFAKTLKAFAFNAPARKRATVWQAQQIVKYDVSKVGPQLIGLYQELIAKKAQAKDNTSNESKD